MTGTYHFWPIITGTTAAYLFSLAAVRLGIYRRRNHHHIWNILLLLNFLATALIGLLLTLQVNYKFPLTGEDTWMLVHVDTGIAMTMIVFFHLGWHLRYFAAIFRRTKTPPEQPPQALPGDEIPGHMPFLPLFAVGFSAMITQLVMLRAFLAVFEGNELVIGIILGNWMLLTALGGRAGRAARRMKTPRQFFRSSLLWLGTLPLLTLMLFFALKDQVFLPGTLTSLPAIFVASFILLLPFCFLSGYAFTFFTWYLFRQRGGNPTARAYAWESAGSLAGGFLFSFVLVFLLDPFHTLTVVLAGDMALWAWLTLHGKEHPSARPAAAMALAGALLLFLLPLDRFFLGFLYPHQEIVEHRESPFGSLVVTRTGEQMNLYENHNLVATTLNVTANEEDVHYAMVQRPAPHSVLLLSGGISGTLAEVLKYPSVERLDYVEIDPAIIRLGKKYFPFPEDPRLHVIIHDGRRYLARTQERYDVVLVNVPPPVTAQLNRYYTLDFFRIVHDHLRQDGVLSLRLPASQNYLGEEESDINALLLATLRRVFPHVVIVPGEKNYFLASDAPLSLDIARLVTERGIDNRYVSPYYLMDDLLKMRSAQIMASLQLPERVNSDRDPRAYFDQIAVWLSYYRADTRLLILFLALFFLFFVVRSGVYGRVIFAGGVAAAAAEVLLLFLFETVYGYLYLMTGILVTLFMAGMAWGARPPEEAAATVRSFLRTALLLALAMSLLPLLAWVLRRLDVLPLAGEMLLFLYTLAYGYGVGRLFREGSLLEKGDAGHIASRLYSADVAGGALGALSVATLLLPLAGITTTALLLATLLLLTSAAAAATK